MPAINPIEVARHARFALTNDPDADSPTDDQFDFAIEYVIDEFLAANPCTADTDNPGQTSLTSAADIRALERALGAYLAEEFVGTPAGSEFAGQVVEVDVGPVTEKTAQTTVEEAQRILRRKAERARRLIGCIRTAIASANTANTRPGFFGLAGYRRTVGTSPTIQGQILGDGDGL